MMSLQHVKTHFLLLLADVTNLLPAKGQYFNEKRYRKYFHHNFIIVLLFQGAPSLLPQLQAANNPTELMCRNEPHSLISAFRWCLHKCNSRLPFAIQLLTVLCPGQHENASRASVPAMGLRQNVVIQKMD